MKFIIKIPLILCLQNWFAIDYLIMILNVPIHVQNYFISQSSETYLGEVSSKHNMFVIACLLF